MKAIFTFIASLVFGLGLFTSTAHAETEMTINVEATCSSVIVTTSGMGEIAYGIVSITTAGPPLGAPVNGTSTFAVYNTDVTGGYEWDVYLNSNDGTNVEAHKHDVVFCGIAPEAPVVPASTFADCTGVSVTAGTGTYALVGLDAGPPFQVNAEKTKTFTFFPNSNDSIVSHSYSVGIYDAVSGAQVSFDYQTVDGCNTIPFPEPTEPIVMVPGVRIVDPVVVTEILSVRRLNGPW